MIKIILFILASLLLSAKFLSGQSFSYPVGAPAMALGHASVASKNFWAIFNNQAGAADIEHVMGGIFFENRYLVPDLGHAAAGACLPAGKGRLFFHLDHGGAQNYAETRTGLGYSMRQGKSLLAGAQLDHFLMHVGEGYGNFHAFTFEGGVMIDVITDLTFGMHVFNPLRLPWINTGEHLPVIMRGGMAYTGIMDFSLLAEVQKTTDSPAMLCLGAEYNFRGRFFMRAGISSGPSRFTFGMGMKIRGLMLDLSSGLHEWLGYSPQISILYGLKK